MKNNERDYNELNSQLNSLKNSKYPLFYYLLLLEYNMLLQEKVYL